MLNRLSVLQVVNVTGNQDICFYNFLCAHPLGALRFACVCVIITTYSMADRFTYLRCRHWLSAFVTHSAFNNILSNMGYVMLGLLFLLIVLKRDIVHSRALERNDLNALVRLDGLAHSDVCVGNSKQNTQICSVSSSTFLSPTFQECGIPKHFGLFYAMGTALMMEGLLSACYHVCPNYTNFQFGKTASFPTWTLCVSCTTQLFVVSSWTFLCLICFLELLSVQIFCIASWKMIFQVTLCLYSHRK